MADVPVAAVGDPGLVPVGPQGLRREDRAGLRPAALARRHSRVARVAAEGGVQVEEDRALGPRQGHRGAARRRRGGHAPRVALGACPRTPPRPGPPWTRRRIAGWVGLPSGNTFVFPSGFVRRPARSTTLLAGPGLLGQTLRLPGRGGRG